MSIKEVHFLNHTIFNDIASQLDSFDSNISIEHYLVLYTESLKQLEKYRKINILTTVLFIVIGLLGHFLTIFVFVQKRFRKNSSNVYLLCLAINDALFLITHFFEDTIRTYINLNEEVSSPFLESLNITDRFNLSCQLINYFRCVLRFISAYIIVAFSIQRLYIIQRPFSNKFKSTKSAWITVATTTCISFIINSWVPFLFEINFDDVIRTCDVKRNWSVNYFHITLIYISLIMLIPIMIIIVSNSLIILNILRARIEQKNLNEKRRTPVQRRRMQNLKLTTEATHKVKPYYLNIDQMINRVTSKANSTKRLTKILVLISFSYAFLNLPYFITW